MSDVRSPRFENLMQGYLEGVLTPDESREMLNMLETNPALGHALLEELAFSDVLKSLVGEQDRSAAATSASQRRSKISPMTAPVVHRKISKRRRAQKPGGWIVIGLAASMALIVVLGISNGWFSSSTPTPEISAPEIAVVTAGAVGARVSRANGQIRSIEIGMKLHDGERIQAASDEGVTIEYPDGTRVEFEADSIVHLREEGGAKRVSLEQGELIASIAKQPAGKPMLFITPSATAVVLGTRLSIALAGNSARLDVTEGTVRFETDPAHGVEVKQGFSALARAGENIALTTLGEPLPWRHATFSNKVVIEKTEERTPKGHPVLKLTYNHRDIPENKKEYCMLSQPITVSASTRFIRVAYNTLSAGTNARINAVLTTKDHGSWYISEQILTHVAANAWHEFLVPLDKPQKKQNNVGSMTFDKTNVVYVSVSIWGGKAVMLLGDANVSE